MAAASICSAGQRRAEPRPIAPLLHAPCSFPRPSFLPSPPLSFPSLPFPPRSCCLVNLCAGPLLSLYIQAVDRAQRHAELRNFPVFGVPLLLLLASACLGLLCVPPPPPPLLLRGTPLSA